MNESTLDFRLSMLSKISEFPELIRNTIEVDDKLIIKYVTKQESIDNFCDAKHNQKYTIENAQKGVRVIHIFEYEWQDSLKREKLTKFIKQLVLNNTVTVYARKCNVDYINNKELKQFLNDNHFQGYVGSKINIGLRYNNELVGIMTFGKPRFNYDCEYELIRLAFKENLRVIGGTERMFKHFLTEFNPSSIISYCDIGKFTGNSYTKLGFTTSAHDITSPNYMWVNSDSTLALPRYKCMKHKLLAAGLGTPDMTENEIMISNGFYKAYDCGNLKLIWEAKEQGIQE